MSKAKEALKQAMIAKYTKVDCKLLGCPVWIKHLKMSDDEYAAEQDRQQRAHAAILRGVHDEDHEQLLTMEDISNLDVPLFNELVSLVMETNGMLKQIDKDDEVKN